MTTLEEIKKGKLEPNDETYIELTNDKIIHGKVLETTKDWWIIEQLNIANPDRIVYLNTTHIISIRPVLPKEEQGEKQ